MTVPQKPPTRRQSWLMKRNTGDILVLLIASTVCFAVTVSVISVVILQFVQPENKGGFAVVGDVINTLISLMAGFLAGRTDATSALASKEVLDNAEIAQRDNP
jgi:hypothetical protein